MRADPRKPSETKTSIRLSIFGGKELINFKIRNGNSALTNAGSDDNRLFINELCQNTPNPFALNTTIAFSLKTYGQISLKIYNAAGQLVRTLVNGSMAPGRYEARWDGENEQGISAASGIYIYKITSGEFTDTRKMLLIR